MPQPSNTIFVFGSNLAGIHGAGAAHEAKANYGAQSHVGVGLTGNAYAIPTKNGHLQPLPLFVIELYVKQFCDYSRLHWKHKTGYTFITTRVGCGLAGYTDLAIAPMFSFCTPNVLFDKKWKPFLGDLHHYWGTYP